MVFGHSQAVDDDLPLISHQQPIDQPGNGTLPAPVFTDQGRPLPPGKLEVELFEHRLACPRICIRNVF